MDRKEFISTCGLACVKVVLISSFLPACSPGKFIEGTLANDDLIVPISGFTEGKDLTQRSYVIVRNGSLKYPVCVYRFSDTEYSALWLQCTHQGTELQVFGDRLQCPAHGSEFTTRGLVQNGPADKMLRTFPVTVEGEVLKISLRKVG